MRGGEGNGKTEKGLWEEKGEREEGKGRGKEGKQHVRKVA